MATPLTDQQVADVQALVNAGDYPGAYNYLADVNNAMGADSRTSKWLDAAAAINTPSENFSFWSRDNFHHHMVTHEYRVLPQFQRKKEAATCLT